MRLRTNQSERVGDQLIRPLAGGLIIRRGEPTLCAHLLKLLDFFSDHLHYSFSFTVQCSSASPFRSEASILNRRVLLYAVPMGLRRDRWHTARGTQSGLPSHNRPVCSNYRLVHHRFALGRDAFRAKTSVSALIALAVSAPAVPFMGPAVLGDTVRNRPRCADRNSRLIVNITVVPVPILPLSLNTTKSPIQRDNPVLCNSECAQSRYAVLASILVETLKQPIVWAPVAAFAIVLVALRTPPLLIHSLSLMGQAAGGVSLFASGIILGRDPKTIDITAFAAPHRKTLGQLRSGGRGASGALLATSRRRHRNAATGPVREVDLNLRLIRYESCHKMWPPMPSEDHLRASNVAVVDPLVMVALSELRLFSPANASGVSLGA